MNNECIVLYCYVSFPSISASSNNEICLRLLLYHGQVSANFITVRKIALPAGVNEPMIKVLVPLRYFNQWSSIYKIAN